MIDNSFIVTIVTGQERRTTNIPQEQRKLTLGNSEKTECGWQTFSNKKVGCPSSYGKIVIVLFE